MKIAYVSRTLHSGLPEKMAQAVIQYTPHEAVALVPGTWMDGKRTFLPGERTPLLWNVNDEEQRNHVLETSDCLHFIYNTSLDDLGRPDLAAKKTVVWHLATRWNRVFESLFPRGPGRTHFVLSAEGWCRYGLWEAVDWQLVPVIFLLDHPAYQPIAFSRRTRHVSMSIRVKLDTTDDGRPIAAPRSSKAIAEALKPLGKGKFRRIHGLDWQRCMKRKASAWIGIDDIVNPLVHQSGLEYLALGVPCLNEWDEHLTRVCGLSYGSCPPFFDTNFGDLLNATDDLFGMKRADWKTECDETRAWMLEYAHPRETIRRYLELYERASVV